MALVKDSHDKQGMFSKAGRFTTEKYIIFQRKDEILHGKKRVLKVAQFSNPIPENKDPSKNQQDIKKKEEKKDDTRRKKEEDQPFYKQLSREKRNLISSVKNTTKPVGYYKPKYTEIDRSLHLLWDQFGVEQRRTVPKIGKKKISEDQEIEEFSKQMTRPVPEQTLRKTTGMIELGRQLRRKYDFIKNGNDPHPDRFFDLKLPRNWSNMKKTQTFSIDRTQGREDNKGYFSKEHQPDYNPNYEFGRRQIGPAALNVAKMPPRKPFYKVSDTDNEQFYEYDKYNKTNRSQIFRNIKSSPQFDKILPREMDPNSPLPSFMQKHVNMRSTLQTLHHKMLEENYFSDGRFQSTASQFARSGEFFNKKNVEEDEEEESFEEQNQ